MIHNQIMEFVIPLLEKPVFSSLVVLCIVAIDCPLIVLPSNLMVFFLAILPALLTPGLCSFYPESKSTIYNNIFTILNYSKMFTVLDVRHNNFFSYLCESTVLA